MLQEPEMTDQDENSLPEKKSRREFLNSTATASMLGALAAAGYAPESQSATPLSASASARA